MTAATDRRHTSRLRWYRRSTTSNGEPVLGIHTRTGPGCWVLLAGSELDEARRDEFAVLLDGALSSGARVVILDLRRTVFLSIRVAASLAAAKRATGQRGVDLRLVGGGRQVQRALDLVGVRPLFRYYTTVDEASTE
ncbi:STAS domain-containing protein [Nocardia neocaledoniensis]|uniref:STAS domain-containing protein n=1 Tax=Nocardia neocaledoniensis TaxID=236511 RepID=UPI002458819E|nr:STAS domain-containing protein [Nocardia neocaledoniensis]